jgi:uncharacterized membrane protein YgcG
MGLAGVVEVAAEEAEEEVAVSLVPSKGLTLLTPPQNASNAAKRAIGPMRVRMKLDLLARHRLVEVEVGQAAEAEVMGQMMVSCHSWREDAADEEECYKCHQTGHWASACPNEDQGGSRSTGRGGGGGGGRGPGPGSRGAGGGAKSGGELLVPDLCSQVH